MALLDCEFFSNVLRTPVSMMVILPQNTQSQTVMTSKKKDSKLPTLYLLHGICDSHTSWIRRTSIERYVADMELAVVMPSVGRGFYTDAAWSRDLCFNAKYWTFISEEVPEVARSFFQLSEEREDNFAAGLSMGGYGALKLALRCPDKFIAAASLSGAVDMELLGASDSERITSVFNHAEFQSIFGDIKEAQSSENDLFYLAEKLAVSDGQKPMLYSWCGYDDYFYPAHIKLKNHIEKLGFDATFEESQGDHEWKYWDEKIQRVLQWLPVRGK